MDSETFLFLFSMLPGNILRLEGLHVEDGIVCCVLICVIVDVDLSN